MNSQGKVIICLRSFETLEEELKWFDLDVNKLLDL